MKTQNLGGLEAHWLRKLNQQKISIKFVDFL